MATALFLVGFLAAIPKKSKALNRIFLLLFIGLMILVFSGNNSTPDQISYKAVYDGYYEAYFEFGYMMITSALRTISFDYTQFKIVVAVIVVIMMKFRFRDVGSRVWSLSLVFWVLSSFWVEIEQSRFYIAMVIVLFATRYLEDKTVTNMFKYVLFVFVAMQFHTSAAFYLLMVVIFVPNYQKIRIFIFMTFLTVSLISLVCNNDWSFLGEILYSATKNERVLFWFGMRTNFGYIGPLFVQLIIYTLLSYNEKVMRIYYHRIGSCEKEKISLCYTSKKISEVLFLAVPLYMISTDFIRIERGFLLLFFLSTFQCFKYMDFKQKALSCSLLIALIIVFNLICYRNIIPIANPYFGNMLLYNDWN